VEWSLFIPLFCKEASAVRDDVRGIKAHGAEQAFQDHEEHGKYQWPIESLLDTLFNEKPIE
jgi:hypothetical protein